MIEYLTQEKLKTCLPSNKEIDIWYPIIQKYLTDWGFVTKEQVAMFLAQCAHESNEFKVLSENLNYSSEGLQKTFGKYFNKATADLYQRQPEKIANRVYANRMGNRDESSGDGWKYRGAGIIQLTGKNNHKKFADFCEKSIDDIGDYLRTKEGAMHSAVWFWEINKLKDWGGDVDKVSDIINRGRTTEKIGDAIGYLDRKKKYDKILSILQ